MTSDLSGVSMFTLDAPRREWFVGCTDARLRPGVCAVEANDGEITIVGPGEAPFTFSHREIAELQTALAAAITQAAQDLADS
ncbi:hypothetical protein ACFWY9_18700 [Amycolatopsis sp. NPDC059027]|uniref:hypothetical protein n=1 Tax=Amycolatopsis sp. NPDC059027 TaxID=3346709 RepID=UPI0036713C26